MSKEVHLQIAGLRSYLNSSRNPHLPSIFFEHIKRSNASLPAVNPALLLSYARRQFARYPPQKDATKRLHEIANRDKRLRHFLSSIFRNLRSRDKKYVPVFLGGIDTFFINPPSLKARCYFTGHKLDLNQPLFIYVTFLLAKNAGFLLHASAVIRKGKAYLFVAQGGGGKTTAANLSRRLRVLDDDVVVVRKVRKSFLAFSPAYLQNQKTDRLYVQKGYPVKAVFFLKKAKEISFVQISKPEVFQETLLYHIHNFRILDDYSARRVFFTAYEFFKSVPVFEMYFTRHNNFWPLLEKYLKLSEA